MSALALINLQTNRQIFIVLVPWSTNSGMDNTTDPQSNYTITIIISWCSGLDLAWAGWCARVPWSEFNRGVSHYSSLRLSG